MDVELVTLRDHLTMLLVATQDKNEVRFVAMEKATVAALAAAQRAVEKAEIAVEKRLEGMNEFRGTLSDQASMLMPRAEAENRLTTLSERVAALSSRIDRGEGKGSGLSAGWGYLVGAVGLLGSILSVAYAVLK